MPVIVYGKYTNSREIFGVKIIATHMSSLVGRFIGGICSFQNKNFILGKRRKRGFFASSSAPRKVLNSIKILFVRLKPFCYLVNTV